MHVLDAVHGGVAQQHVGRGHVDLGAQHATAIRELTGLHALEQVQVLLRRTVAIGTVHARLGQRAAILAHLLRRLVVHVGQAAADHAARDLVQAIEEIGGEVEVVPLEAQPLDVGLDALDECLLLLGGVGVVKAQVAGAAILPGGAEVHAQRLGVADVQIAIRLRREAGLDVVKATAGQILIDVFLDKVACASCFVLHFQSPQHSFPKNPVLQRSVRSSGLHRRADLRIGCHNAVLHHVALRHPDGALLREV